MFSYADFASGRSGKAGWRPCTLSSFIRYCAPGGLVGQLEHDLEHYLFHDQRRAGAPVSLSMARWAMAFSADSVKPSSAFSMVNRA